MALTSIALPVTDRKASGLQSAAMRPSSLPVELKFNAPMAGSCLDSAACSGDVMIAPMNFALSCVASLRAARIVVAG
jgi:hypothetical protein